MMIKRRILIALFVALATGVAGQPANRDIVDQDLEWFSITSNIELTKTLSLMVEGQFRYAHGFEPMQYQARTALDIKVGDHFVLTPLGYVYTWNYFYNKFRFAVIHDIPTYRYYQRYFVISLFLTIIML